MQHIMVYGAPSGTANDIASLQIPSRGIIRGVQWMISADLDADGEAAIAELSLLPLFQSSTLGTRNVLCFAALWYTLTSSGASLGSAMGWVPMNMPVSPLQTLYLNAVLVGTTAAIARFLVHFDDRAGGFRTTR